MNRNDCYLIIDRNVLHPEEVLLPNLLTHLVQLLDQLSDAGLAVVVGRSEALDPDQLLLVLVHLVISRT